MHTRHEYVNVRVHQALLYHIDGTGGTEFHQKNRNHHCRKLRQQDSPKFKASLSYITSSSGAWVTESDMSKIKIPKEQKTLIHKACSFLAATLRVMYKAHFLSGREPTLLPFLLPVPELLILWLLGDKKGASLHFY